MKVRATRVGYYEHIRRRLGDVFTPIPREVTLCNVDAGKPLLDEKGKPKMRLLTPEDQFSHIWMERVDADEPEKITPAPEALAQAQKELKRSRG